MSLAPEERRRRALIAVLLAGLAPPGGHVYVGRPLRGFVLLLLSFGAGLAWILIVPGSLHRAQAVGLAGALLLLAVIVDAGLLARHAPECLPPRRLHRWWTYVLLAVLTQAVVPDQLFRLLNRRAGLALHPDSAMEPVVLENERLVFERLPPESLAERDTLVVLENEQGDLLVRRVAGLPGESVSVEAGVVTIDGLEWLDDRFRLRRRPDLDLEETQVRRGELLVLGDRRRATDPVQGLVAFERVRGRASWILQPPGFPRDPMFGGRLGETPR